jgi:hypothetical protein
MFFESIVNFFQSVVKCFKSILFKEVKVEVKVEVQILLSSEEEYINDIEKKFQESYENKNVEWSSNIYEKESVASYFKNKTNESYVPCEKKWKSRILFEPTPRGNIIMMYDTYTEAFVYYIDTSGTPYKLLNAVAMKYVLTFHCRDFFVDENKILEGFTSPFIENHMVKNEVEKNRKVTFFNELTNGDSDSPFARLKTRNVVANDAKKIEATQNVKIQNRFISQGKICNYSFLQKGVCPKKKINVETTYKSHKSTKRHSPDNGLNGICSLMNHPDNSLNGACSLMSF